MPVSAAAACLVNEDCPIVAMPTRSANCGTEVSAGGFNDIYFPPCTETISEANVLDTDWWQALVTAGTLGSIGLGVGSLGKKSVKTEKVGSCRTEQIVSITWALKYTIRCIDKTSAESTKAQIEAILKRFQNFGAIARMCEGADRVLPIGPFTTSDVDWIVPENSEDAQTLMFEISWIEFNIPRTYEVAGLSSVIPKA